MLASDEASGSVSEVGGGALRRFRIVDSLVLVSGSLIDVASLPSHRLERRRRLTTLVGRFSSGISRFGVAILALAIALVVALVSACCGFDPSTSFCVFRLGVQTAEAFAVVIALCWLL